MWAETTPNVWELFIGQDKRKSLAMVWIVPVTNAIMMRATFLGVDAVTVQFGDVDKAKQLAVRIVIDKLEFMTQALYKEGALDE